MWPVRTPTIAEGNDATALGKTRSDRPDSPGLLAVLRSGNQSGSHLGDRAGGLSDLGGTSCPNELPEIRDPFAEWLDASRTEGCGQLREYYRLGTGHQWPVWPAWLSDVAVHSPYGLHLRW